MKLSCQRLHWSLEQGWDSEPILSEVKAFPSLSKKYCLLCILICIKCFFKPNSEPGIEIPVLAMDLPAFFKIIKSRGEEFQGVQREWRLFTKGSGLRMLWAPGPLPQGWKVAPATDILPGLGPIVTVSGRRRIPHIPSGVRFYVWKCSDAGLRNDEWSCMGREGQALSPQLQGNRTGSFCVSESRWAAKG